MWRIRGLKNAQEERLLAPPAVSLPRDGISPAPKLKASLWADLPAANI